jgi:CIC family chloride channel protein
MKLTSIFSFREEFDFRLAGRWLVLGSIVGVVSGVGAILFQTLLGLLREFTIIHSMGLQPVTPGGEPGFSHFMPGNFNPYLIVLIPAIGGLVVGFLIRNFAPEAEGHGTDEAIKAFHHKRGMIRPLVPIVKLVASVISIGTGGSGGREGPIAQIGAGFGSFLATRLHLDTKTRRWLLAAGMGAGIGSIFRAPLAGAIFAAEVLYLSAEVETEVLLPATVSSIIAYSVYSFRYGWDHIFTNAGLHGFTNPLELFPYTLEALILTLAAFVFVKTFYGTRKVFTNRKIPGYLKPAIGGLLTGGFALLLITITNDRKYVIDVMGGGYGILQEIFQDGIVKVGFGALLLVAAGKILTTSFTISSGGSAGVFGPSMVIGGTLGAAIGYVMQFVFPDLHIYPATYAIVGMAGFFAAAAKTPLSTIIMVSELTGNYALLMPSMWVCSLSYLLARGWTIYESQVPGKLYSQAHLGEFAPDIFETISVQDAYKKTRSFITIAASMKFADIISATRNISQRIFPVVSESGQLVGTFTISDVTIMLQESNSSEMTASELMNKIIPAVKPTDHLSKAQKIMLSQNLNELLVIDEQSINPEIMGIITSADILLAYNRKLSQIKFGNEKPELLPKDEIILEKLDINKVLEKDILTIDPEASLRDLVKIIIRSKRNVFPVVDSENRYFGMILLNDVRELMFDQEKYDTVVVKSIMIKPAAIINSGDTMGRVMEKFDKTHAWNLPVVNKNNRYIGMVSQSSIFASYRNQLIFQTDV